MSTVHELRPIDDRFFDEAPLVVPVTLNLRSSPAAVWEALGSDRMWSWFPGIDRLVWESPRPLGEGAVRSLRIARLFTVREEFYRWEENRRATFRVTHITRPLLRGLAEDFVLDPYGSGTRLTWTMAIDPAVPRSDLLKPLAPLLGPGNAWAIGGLRKLLPDG